MKYILYPQPEFGKFKQKYQTDNKAGEIGYRSGKCRTCRAHCGNTEKTEYEYRVEEYVQEYHNNTGDRALLDVSDILEQCLENISQSHEYI